MNRTVHLLPVLLLAVMPSAARAQQIPRFEVAASYGLIEGIGYGNDYHRGWVVSGTRYAWNWWGVTGEIGGGYKSFNVGSAPPLKASIYDIMLGPRAGMTNHKVMPFAQVLAGGIRVGNNYGGFVKDFAWQPGGGLDVRIRRTLAVRLQGDLRFIESGGVIKEFRFATGVVFKK